MFGLPEGRRKMKMHYKGWEKRTRRGEQRPNDSWDNRSTQSGGIFLNLSLSLLSLSIGQAVPLQMMTVIWWI
jgi:hypothetical protein